MSGGCERVVGVYSMGGGVDGADSDTEGRDELERAGEGVGGIGE